MAVNEPLYVVQNNLVALSIAITKSDLTPFNLTGMTLSFVVKASATATDASGTTYTPTVTNAVGGLASLSIPGSGNATPGTNWYRLDVIDGSSNHVTALEGIYQVAAA